MAPISPEAPSNWYGNGLHAGVDQRLADVPRPQSQGRCHEQGLAHLQPRRQRPVEDRAAEGRESRDTVVLENRLGHEAGLHHVDRNGHRYQELRRLEAERPQRDPNRSRAHHRQDRHRQEVARRRSETNSSEHGNGSRSLEEVDQSIHMQEDATDTTIVGNAPAIAVAIGFVIAMAIVIAIATVIVRASHYHSSCGCSRSHRHRHRHC